jgi:hypothetical protein
MTPCHYRTLTINCVSRFCFCGFQVFNNSADLFQKIFWNAMILNGLDRRILQMGRHRYFITGKFSTTSSACF